MLVTVTSVSFLLLAVVYSAAGNCLVGGCGGGLCCSAFGYCGSTAEHCGSAGVAVGGAGGGAGAVGGAPAAGGCRTYGCPAGQCCSQHGYCGTTAEHCGGGAAVVQPGAGNGGYGAVNTGNGGCGGVGCAAGSCCSAHGFCGNTAAHCAGSNGYGNCYSTGCGAGLCCSKFGYCGSSASHCAVAKFMAGKQPASLEGQFQAYARYYNETMASSDYSTCGISRARSLDENDEQIYVAALNEAQFDPYTTDGIPSTNPICEKKAIVKGAKGEITVRFVDRCRGCKKGEIALTHDGFTAVSGELGDGVTDIVWHFL